MKTVGRTTIGEYEAALREIANPISEDYVSDPNSTMSCDELVAGINYITARVQLWTTRLNALRYRLFSGDKETAANISQILQVLNVKLQLYQTLHQSKCLNVQAVPQPSIVDPMLEVIPSNGSGGSMMLPLLLLAGGIWFISRKKRRSQRRSKRKR